MSAATGRAVGTVLQRAVGAVTVVVVVGVLVAPRMSVNRYGVLAAAVGLVLVVAAWLALAGPLPRLLRLPHRRWDAVAAALCLLQTAVAALFAYYGAYRTGWDASAVKHAATGPVDQKVINDFTAYPNLRPFLAVARTVYGWGKHVGLDYEGGFAVVNSASFLVTAVAVYVAVRLVAGPARGVLALLLLGLLLATSPWLSVAYTDSTALWAPIAAVALAVAAIGWRRGLVGPALLAAAAGVVLAAGYLVKTTPLVGLVALVMTVVVGMAARDGSVRRLLTIGVCAVAAFFVAVPALGAWAKSAERLPPIADNLGATPLTYVADGIRTQIWPNGTIAYGAWDRTVVRDTRGQDAATQNAVARRFIQQEWNRRGLVGTARFAVAKTLFNWGDGTFWARGEGADATAPALRHGTAAKAVMAWNAPRGGLWGFHVLLVQIVWTAALLALGAGLVLSRYRPELLLMALTVAGIAAFTLLFQGRSRYLMDHAPVVVALAACVVPRPRLPRRHRDAGLKGELPQPAVPTSVTTEGREVTDPEGSVAVRE